MGSLLPVFEFTVVRRHITYRKWRTFLSVGAVALAVAISIIMISIQNGFSDFLFDIVFRFLPHITVSPSENEDYIHIYRNIIDYAWALPGVLGVSPTLTATATLAYKDKADNVAMIGIEPEEADKISEIAKNMIQGDINSVLGGKRVVLGRALADKLKVKTGDTVQAKFPDAIPTNLVVSGLFNFGYKPVDEGVVYVSLDTAREFLDQGHVITSIDIKLEDPFQAQADASKLRSYGYNAKEWQELFPDIVRTIVLERTQNAITLLLLMIVASFGIASIMNILVQEKTAEIGMLMAMGATSGNIRKLFLLESAVLGLMGAIIGCFIGLIVSLQLKGIEIPSTFGEKMNLPIAINPMDFLAFTLLAVFLSTVAGAYPAHKASRLDPIIALKG